MLLCRDICAPLHLPDVSPRDEVFPDRSLIATGVAEIYRVREGDTRREDLQRVSRHTIVACGEAEGNTEIATRCTCTWHIAIEEHRLGIPRHIDGGVASPEGIEVKGIRLLPARQVGEDGLPFVARQDVQPVYIAVGHVDREAVEVGAVRRVHTQTGIMLTIARRAIGEVLLRRDDHAIDDPLIGRRHRCARRDGICGRLDHGDLTEGSRLHRGDGLCYLDDSQRVIAIDRVVLVAGGEE